VGQFGKELDPSQQFPAERRNTRERNTHEEAETEIVVRLLLLLRGLLLLGGSATSSSAGVSGRGGGGVRLRVREAVLEGLDLREGVVGLEGDGKDALVSVDKRVGDRGEGGVRDRERDGCDGLDALHEAADELVLRDVEDRGREELALGEDLDDLIKECIDRLKKSRGNRVRKQLQNLVAFFRSNLRFSPPKIQSHSSRSDSFSRFFRTICYRRLDNLDESRSSGPTWPAWVKNRESCHRKVSGLLGRGL
jgi:hypothetical protein